jgi:hypothetical protein
MRFEGAEMNQGFVAFVSPLAEEDVTPIRVATTLTVSPHVPPQSTSPAAQLCTAGACPLVRRAGTNLPDGPGAAVGALTLRVRTRPPNQYGPLATFSEQPKV